MAEITNGSGLGEEAVNPIEEHVETGTKISSGATLNGNYDAFGALPLVSELKSLSLDNGAASIPDSHIVQLAKIIAAQTAKVDAYFNEHGIVPSFEPDGRAEIPSLPEDVQDARKEIVRATSEMRDLVLGPEESLRWMAWNHNDSLSLRAVNQWRIANLFPLGSTTTYSEIAAKINVNEMNVRRLLRHAMTNHIFQEPSPGVVAHTAQSKFIAENQSMQDWIGFSTEDMWGAAEKTIPAIEAYPACDENTQTGFQFSNDTINKEPMFMTLGKDPKRGKRFGGAMVSLTGGQGYELHYLVDNYDWKSVDERQGTVVDLGGSHGFVSIQLAETFKNIKFVVQDLPKMVASAPKLEGELAERVTFEGHDFLQQQPVKGADVYLYRWILHNQSDKYALTMLRALIPALKKGSKVVINDHCLPEPGQESLWDEKIIRTMDLVMLTLLNAQERSADEFATLFAKADPRYKFIGVTRPKGCRMSIVEAVWEGEDAVDAPAAAGVIETIDAEEVQKVAE